MSRIIALLVVFSILGCTRRTYVSHYAEPLPAKSQDEQIDVYNTTLPARPYREIGDVEVHSNPEKSMKKILQAARKMGGDAVILQGPAGSQSDAVLVTHNYAVGHSRQFGKRAVVIVYTDR